MSAGLVPGATRAFAQPLDADAQAAGRVVMQQLEAFRRDDFATAYTFASVNVRQMFDRAGFEQMVRGGYPEIAHSASATVDGSRRGDAGEIYLFIRVLGDNGQEYRGGVRAGLRGRRLAHQRRGDPPRCERARIAFEASGGSSAQARAGRRGERKTSSAGGSAVAARAVSISSCRGDSVHTGSVAAASPVR